METGAAAVYQSALNKGRFIIQRCNDCDRHVFYPRELCPHCSGSSLAWEDASGTGTVYSTTTVRRKPDAGGDYNVSLIELAEGVRMMSTLKGVLPDEVRIGMAVKAVIIDQAGSGLLVFERAGEPK